MVLRGKMKRFTWIACFVAIASIVPYTYSITSPAATFNLETATFRVFGDSTIGWEFTVMADVFVTDLGWIDMGDSGLESTHEIGIFDENRVLIVSTVLESGITGVFKGGFRYQPISPVRLTVGQNYVIAGRVGTADNIGISSYDPLPPKFLLHPEISLVGGRTNGGHSLFNYPGAYFRADRVYLGPNFQLVPEPGTMGLVAVGAVAMVRKRRK